MSRGLASNYSMYWPIYGLKKKLYGFHYRPIKSLRNKPPQVIQTIAISHQLQLVPQHQLHRSVPFADAVTWICVVFWSSVCSWVYCPNVECYAFIWNQLVLVTAKATKKIESDVWPGAHRKKVNDQPGPTQPFFQGCPRHEIPIR